MVKINIEKVSIEFTAEEIEAIHYVLSLGVRTYGKSKNKYSKDWFDMAESIKKRLPTKLHLNDLERLNN